MKRDRQPEGGRFTPLADIFTSATAAILLLLLISSRAPNNVAQREQSQADLVYACVESRSGRQATNSTGDAPIMRLHPGEDRPRFGYQTIGADLAAARPGERLAVRVQLLISPRDRACHLQFENVVAQLNDRFDATSLTETAQATAQALPQGTPARPRPLYYLLDVALSADDAPPPSRR